LAEAHPLKHSLVKAPAPTGYSGINPPVQISYPWQYSQTLKRLWIINFFCVSFLSRISFLFNPILLLIQNHEPRTQKFRQKVIELLKFYGISRRVDHIDFLWLNLSDVKSVFSNCCR